MGSYPFILLRGLARESRHWGDFTNHLSEQGFCAQIVTPDCPGTGKAVEQRAPWCIFDYVLALKNQVDSSLSQGPKKPIIVGLSMGGMFAFDWYKNHPNDFSGCILINSSMAACSPIYHRLRPSNYPLILTSLFANMSTREKAILRMVSNFKADDPKLFTLWLEIQKSAPVKLTTIMRQIIAAARYAPSNDLSVEAAKKLLVLCSQKDRLVNYQCSQKIAKRYGCEIKIHQEAGHDIPIDDPAWLIQNIASFVRNI